ncbi:terminase large subunit [Pseudomonas phage PJNP053]
MNVEDDNIFNIGVDRLSKAISDHYAEAEMEKEAPTVEKWLNSVCYDYALPYIPGLFAIEFVQFIKLVNGGQGEENKTPVLHYRMLDQVGSGERRIANMVFRGAAKTTLMGEYLFLYLGVYGDLPGFGKVDLALYVSDSIDNGVKNMRKNLEYRWENSAFLQQFLPPGGGTDFTDIRWKFVNIEGNVFIVKGYGAKTGVRGAKEMGKRPQLAVLDDLVSDEDARSPTVIASIEDTVYKAVDYALHPTRNMIIWSGTPFNAKDPLYKAVESGAWKVNVYPVCEKFPCSEKDFRGAWPDRFTYDFVKKKYEAALKAGKIDTFNQELMLRIMSDEDRLIQDNELQWYDHGSVTRNKNNFNFYITTDFAVSANTAADYSVISVWALAANQSWYWVDGICKRQLMDKNVDDLFRLVQKWRPMSVGIEISGQQAGFIPWLQSEMNNRRLYFTLASQNNKGTPGLRPSTQTSKVERFMVMVPFFKTAKMFFPLGFKSHEWMREFLEEISLVSPAGFRSKHDDVCDTVSQLALMNPIPPSEEAPMHYSHEGQMWESEAEEQSYSWRESYLV